MNHQRRRAVGKILRSYRALKRIAPEEVAAQLSWPLAFYMQAEAGRASLSEGQQEDVRRMLKRATGRM